MAKYILSEKQLEKLKDTYNPEEVTVSEKNGRRGQTLEVRVNPEDIGKVIGRNGRTARSLRTVVSALAGRSVRVDLIETDETR